MGPITTSTLGEVVDAGEGAVRTGPFGTQLHQSDYTEVGTPVVMPKDILNGTVSDATVARIGDSDAERLAEHALQPGDIIYGRRGDIGRHAFITDRERGWICGTGCLRISLGDAPVDPLWLHFYLEQPQVIGWVLNHAVGATMPNLNTGILREIPIAYPPLPIQRRIAAILSAYDDLIENSTRRIVILEGMVAALFSQVHQEALCDTSTRQMSLGEIADGSGGTIRTGPFGSQLHESDYTAGGTPVVMPKDIAARRVDTASIARVPDHIVERLGQHRLDEGDIVYGRRGDIGRRAYIHSRQAGWLCGTGCIRISINRSALHPRYLFEYLGRQEVVGFISGRAIGATMPNLNTSILREVPVVVPTTSVQNKFLGLTRTSDALYENLRAQIELLSRTRDFLLPRLVSAVLDVSKLDIAIPEGTV